jgi:microcystin-dependent protein
MFSVPAVGAAPLAIITTDTSWMLPGALLYIPGAGTFTVVGPPVDPYTVNIVNSGDPGNAPAGTLFSAGSLISPANQRGPIGPAGVAGPQGPAGPQGVGGASAYTTLVQPFTIPAAEGVAFVLSAAAFAVGLIVYVAASPTAGVYCSVAAADATANTLTLQNQNYPGGAPVGTVVPTGATISGTGPQGPQGIQGPVGPVGPQGPIGVAPSGVIAMYGAPTAPAGWLNCDGTAVPRLQFPALFAVISTQYGAGDGSSTFNLPNLQQRFPLGMSATYPLASVGGEAAHTLVATELPVSAYTATATATQGTHTHTDNGHTHTDNGHVHGMDHYHSIGAGQFSHAHSINNTQAGPSATSFNNADITTWRTGAGTTTAAATLPAGNTATASATNAAWGNTVSGNASIATGHASLTTVSAGAITVTVSVTNAGGGGAHNNMPPYLTLNFIIKT